MTNLNGSISSVQTLNGGMSNIRTLKGGMTNTQTLDGGMTNIKTSSGGTANYLDLKNKPSINNVELLDNKTLDDLGIQPKGDYATESFVTNKIAEAQLGGEGGNIDLSGYVTETELNNKGYLTDVPDEYITEEKLNSKGYLTSIPDGYVTETTLNSKGYLTSVPSEYITETELNNKKYLTSIPSEYVTETELEGKNYATETFVTNKIAEAGTGGGGSGITIDAIYPVGSIYMNINLVNPETLFGGTWERLEDTFLLGAGSTYEAGTTGGEASVTLTVDQMPRHKHTGYLGSTNQYANEWRTTNLPYNSGTKKTEWVEYDSLIAAGGDAPHNNMPPYLTVYMWKRTN